MPEENDSGFDFRFLHDASKRLLGYFVHTCYSQYLNLVQAGFRRWHEIGPFLFDVNSLNADKLTYLIGTYLYILACHKGANRRLMNRLAGKQVLYLRGYDFEGSLALGGSLAMGFSSVDSSRFNAALAELLSPHFQLFKVFSPRDVFYETEACQRYFYGDFDRVIQLAMRPFHSVYLNALSWKDGVLQLLDRMDHFVVYVSSITESALWELDQLDTEERRSRVTVIFDEEAIKNKEIELGFQSKMQTDSSSTLIWSKQEPLPSRTADEVRGQLGQKFLLTTPQEFTANIEEHRQRIAVSSSSLAPGDRETRLDFNFYPAPEADGLQEVRDFSDRLKTGITESIAKGTLTCLPLFLNHIQLRIYTTLLLGEHHETGRTLASYNAVMQGAFDYYSRSNALSPAGRAKNLALLEIHSELARYSGVRLLAFGKSDQFDDLSSQALAEFNATFDATKAAVDSLFRNN